MKKLILVAIAISLSSCATLHAINEQKAQDDAKKAAQKQFNENLAAIRNGTGFYSFYLMAAEGTQTQVDTSLNKVRDAFSDENHQIVSPIEVVEIMALRQAPVAKSLGMVAFAYCKEHKNECGRLRPYIDRARRIDSCNEGDGKACLALAADQETLGGPLVTQYYKLACTFGNQAGCSMYQTAVTERAAERQAKATEAMVYEQQEANRNAAAANIMNSFNSGQRDVAQQPAFAPVQVRRPVNCTSQRFGNQVQTNCR